MRNLLLAALVLAATAVASAQSVTNSITITASRQVYASPSSNQLQIAINLTSPLTAGLNDVVSVLSGVGVTATNLTGLEGSSTTPGNLGSTAYLEWSFAIQIELSKAADVISILTKLQQTLMQGNNGWTLSFTAGNATSPAQECPLADLVSDAQNRAKSVASASGFTLGNILALSNGPLTIPEATVPVVRYSYYSVPGVLYATNSIPSSSVCSVAVKFELSQ